MPAYGQFGEWVGASIPRFAVGMYFGAGTIEDYNKSSTNNDYQYEEPLYDGDKSIRVLLLPELFFYRLSCQEINQGAFGQKSIVRKLH